MIEAHGTEARFEAVDLAKLPAAAAVVWIHVTNCDESRELLPLCRFAVPFFTAAAVYFVLKKVFSARIPLGAYCLQRARRLYVPFLFWSGIYLAARLVKHALVGWGSPIVLSPAVLLNGTAHHLWFLPFVGLISMIAFGLAQWSGPPRDQNQKWCALVFCVSGLMFALLPCPVLIRPSEFPLSYFIDHAWDSMPAAFFGAAIFWLLRIVTPGVRLRSAVLVLGIIALASEFTNWNHSIGSHIAGASLLFLTSTQNNRDWTHALWPWAQLAFVIYLVHVLYVELLQTTALRFGGVRSIAADLSVWALALAVSALTARVLLRFHSSRWVVPR